MSTRRCRHVCRCGAVLICGEPDKCAAGTHWTCPACELDAIDAYLHEQVAHEHEQEQETRHEGIRLLQR